MRSRCKYPSSKYFYMYGGAGISVCPEWDNYEIFRAWALSHGYKDNLTIDRINTYGNYCPENCRWITIRAQQRNKRTNHLITLGNETKCVTEWCEILHLNRHTVFKRLRLGWPAEQALLTPVKKTI